MSLSPSCVLWPSVDFVFCSRSFLNGRSAETSALMALMAIPAAEAGIVMLGRGPAGRAGGADGCWLLEAAQRGRGRPLCKPCSASSTGQRNISGSIYFNKPNDTSTSLRRNVKVKWFPLDRKKHRGRDGRALKTEGRRGCVWTFWLNLMLDFNSNKEIDAQVWSLCCRV